MFTAEGIMRHGAEVPDYTIHLQNGDFTNCPKVTFFYGDSKCLYAFYPSFEKAMKKYNVDYTLILGRDLFHCYPVFPLVKEAKEGWRQMVDLLKKEIN